MRIWNWTELIFFAELIMKEQESIRSGSILSIKSTRFEKLQNHFQFQAQS